MTTLQIDTFARLVRLKPRIVMWFQQWSEPLAYSSQLTAVRQAGAVPMVTWDPLVHGRGIPLWEIASGQYDPYLRSSAAIARSWERPIYIRFGHEMNVPGSPFGVGQGGNSPAAYVAAWRHIVTVFHQQGATNVLWVWSPNVMCGGRCPFDAFYPGDPWVDWVALDGYNYAWTHHDRWETFAELFGPSYAVLERLTHKPLMIGETSSVEGKGGKARWISGMRVALARTFTRVRAMIWFQREKDADWRVNSSPASLAAFRLLVRSAPFRSPGSG